MKTHCYRHWASSPEDFIWVTLNRSGYKSRFAPRISNLPSGPDCRPIPEHCLYSPSTPLYHSPAPARDLLQRSGEGGAKPNLALLPRHTTKASKQITTAKQSTKTPSGDPRLQHIPAAYIPPGQRGVTSSLQPAPVTAPPSPRVQHCFFAFLNTTYCSSL